MVGPDFTWKRFSARAISSSAKELANILSGGEDLPGAGLPGSCKGAGGLSSSSRSSQSSSSPSPAKVVEKGVQGVRGGPAEGGVADDQNAQAGCSSGWSLDVTRIFNPKY